MGPGRVWPLGISWSSEESKPLQGPRLSPSPLKSLSSKGPQSLVGPLSCLAKVLTVRGSPFQSLEGPVGSGQYPGRPRQENYKNMSKASRSCHLGISFLYTYNKYQVNNRIPIYQVIIVSMRFSIVMLVTKLWSRYYLSFRHNVHQTDSSTHH